MPKRSNRSISYRWYDPLIFYILFPIVTFLLKLLLSSYRLIRVEGEELEKEALARSGGKAVYCSWHQRLVFHPLYLSKRGVTVMVSQSRDGEFAARLINALGLGDVRGSSTRGGLGALIKLKQKILAGETNGGMVVDGPLGPARVAKKGAVTLAQKSRAPLMPIMWGTDRCRVLNSWDRFIIPKPFAKIVYCHTEPIWVPESANDDELEICRKQLEESLNRAAKWCDEQFGKEMPWRKIKKDGIPETGPVDTSI
ncbi:MAG: lysophospholipid acyltransferase family protein [Deltaproteobacteria bacterium]|nr:lysophospholipid acyltransferase family protein [Deltaproteobacteria bacterium]